MSTATERIQVIIDAAEKAAAGIIEDAEAQARRYLEESRRRAELITAERAQTIAELTDSLIEQAETVKRQSEGLIAALDDAKGKIEQRIGTAPPIPPPPTPVSKPPAPSEPSLQAVKPPPPPAPAPAPIISVPRAPEPPEPPAVEEPEPKPEVEAEPRVEPAPPVESAPPVEPPKSEPPRVEPAPSAEAPPRPFGGSGPGTTEATKLGGSEPMPESAKLLATQMAVAGSSRSEIESRLQSEYGITDAGQMLDSILGPEG